MFSLSGFHLRGLRDQYEFEYRLDHISSCHLSFSFHSMSLVCFLPRAFVPSLGLAHPFTLLSLVGCFRICPLIIFLYCTPIIGSVPHPLFDPGSDFWLNAHIFITKRWKSRFYFHIFFSRFAFITLIIFFSYRARVWRLIQGYVGIDGVSISW